MVLRSRLDRTNAHQSSDACSGLTFRSPASCHMALRQPLHGYGVRRARFLIKQLASPPLGGIRQWYRYLFSSVAAALLSLLSKNALPECSAGVSRAVNKVFTAQCERFSCGKKAVNFEYMNIRFRNTNGVRLASYSSRENLVLLLFRHLSVVRTATMMDSTLVCRGVACRPPRSRLEPASSEPKRPATAAARALRPGEAPWQQAH